MRCTIEPGAKSIHDVVEVEIERMSYGSAAVGRLPAPPEGGRAMVVFVDGAAPGERVSARLLKAHKNYWEAELVSILRPSPNRAEPPCPVFGRCGGCQWQHLSYPAQLAAKEQILLHHLNRGAGLAIEDLRAKLATHPAPSALGYRARVQARGDAGGIGFFAPGSHSLVRTNRCLVAHPDVQRAWTGFLVSGRGTELASATGRFKIEWARSPAGQVSEAINRRHAALGFTQVNPEQSAVLAKVVASLCAGGGKTLFDLYGGDGNLSHALLGKFRHVISVDRFNDGQNPTEVSGLGRISGSVTPVSGLRTPDCDLKSGRIFVKSGVEEFLLERHWRDWGIGKVDCVISDPPRTGSREAARRIAGLCASRVVFVSCDPTTLARDLGDFLAAAPGQVQVDSVHLIDMFPQTYHVESVVSCTLTAAA